MHPDDPKDKELVEKGAVKEMIAGKLRKLEEGYNKLHKWPSITDRRRIKFDTTELFAAIDALEPEPDYEAIVKEIEEYMCKEEYRLRMEGYVMISGASRGESFLKKLKAKHTPVSRETDVREKPEEKDG